MDKREQDVLDQIRQKTADVKMPESLEPENIQRMLEEKQSGDAFRQSQKRRWGVKQTGILAAACLVIVVGIAVWNGAEPGRESVSTRNTKGD